MKKYLFLLLLIPLTAFGQRGYRGWGGGASISSLLPILADSTLWHKQGTTPDTIVVDGALPIKVSGLLSTGTSKFEGEVTVRNNVTLSSSAVTELNADSVSADTGIRSEGGGLFKGDLYSRGKVVGEDSMRTNGVITGKGGASFGATATPVSISSVGKVTAADSIAAGKGIRSEGPALIKGDITARTKAVIYDSARVNLTSKLIGDVEVGTGTEWFILEDSTLTMYGKASFVGDITYRLRHAFIAFQDSAQVIDVAKDVFSRVTNEEDSLFSTVEASFVTVAGDSMTVVSPGDYWSDARVEVEGGVGDRFRMAFFKNGAEVFSTSAKLAAANDSKLLSLAYYFEGLVAGDDLSLRITNLTDSDDPTLTSGTWYLRKEHD